MRNLILCAFIMLFVVKAYTVAQTEDKCPLLPSNAFIVEIQPLNPKRALVLWIINPELHPRNSDDPVYSCPDFTRGHYYSGPTRVSLLNIKDGTVINTIEIKNEVESDRKEHKYKDSFDIPYKIEAGLYYHVQNVKKGEEGKPTIMFLKDYNGDGKALEFALFDSETCWVPGTTLIGYSVLQDKVIQYPIELIVEESGNIWTDVEYWENNFFNKKAIEPGYWKFELDSRGRGGELDKYEIRYNRQKERFEGKLIVVHDEIDEAY